MEERIQRTMKALERNKIKPYYVETREQLYDLVRELVKNDKLITAGGSMTLEESGVKELLMTEFKGVYLDRSEGKTPDEVEDILHKAFVSDTFFASSNAVTEDGALYNVDGRGNRVAAMIYGPAQVVLIDWNQQDSEGYGRGGLSGGAGGCSDEHEAAELQDPVRGNGHLLALPQRGQSMLLVRKAGAAARPRPNKSNHRQ